MPFLALSFPFLCHSPLLSDVLGTLTELGHSVLAFAQCPPCSTPPSSLFPP